MIGLLSPVRSLFQLATPFHLLLTVSVLLCFHRDWRSSFWWFCRFGDAHWVLDRSAGRAYRTYFWFLRLRYYFGPQGAGGTSDDCRQLVVAYLPMWYGSSSLTIQSSRENTNCCRTYGLTVDYLIEPVAIKYDFWHWKTLHPPLHNYLGWLFTALLVQGLFFTISFKKDNPLGLTSTNYSGTFLSGLATLVISTPEQTGSFWG